MLKTGVNAGTYLSTAGSAREVVLPNLLYELLYLSLPQVSAHGVTSLDRAPRSLAENEAECGLQFEAKSSASCSVAREFV